MSTDCPKRVFFRGTQTWYSTQWSPSDLVRGFLEPISDPQGGIPGWTRICFITYFANRDVLIAFDQEEDIEAQQYGASFTSFPDEDWPPVDFESNFIHIYGFEGTILPGGRTILGQWLDLKDEGNSNCARGPFIYWDA